MQEEKRCICCCKTPIRPVSEFAPGHDGRITGFFNKMLLKESEPIDFGSSVAKMWEEWNKLDQPGGQRHPKLKKAAQLARLSLLSDKDPQCP